MGDFRLQYWIHRGKKLQQHPFPNATGDFHLSLRYGRILSEGSSSKVDLDSFELQSGTLVMNGQVHLTDPKDSPGVELSSVLVALLEKARTPTSKTISELAELQYLT